MEINADHDELVAAHHLLDLLSAKIARADAAFDAAQLWDLTGQSSMTNWLVDECSMSNAGASRHTRLARRLHTLPTSAAAFEAGELSAGQVDLLTTWIKPLHVELFGTHEARLIPTWVSLDIEATVEILTAWTARADAILDANAPQTLDRSRLHLDKVLDDHGHLDAQLTLDDTAIAAEALRLARRPDDDGDAGLVPGRARPTRGRARRINTNAHRP